MKLTYTKLLLLSFIAVIFATASSSLTAKGPATPKELKAKVELNNNPEKSDVTLNWIDGDLKNELGDNFLITQYQKIEGKEKEEKIAYVKRDSHKQEYSYKIKEVENGNYCYSITLLDKGKDLASEESKRACVEIKTESQDKRMSFNYDNKLIQLNEKGQGSYFVNVKNGTKCEFEIVVIRSEIKTEFTKTNNEGATINFSASEKGKYTVLLGLKDKCTDEIVDKVELQVCYGECKNNDKGMRFVKERMAIKLDDNGMWVSEVHIINDTDCEYEIVIVESEVKIEVKSIEKNTAVLSLTASEKGNYTSTIGLKNKCNGEIVSKMKLDICYGDCTPNVAELYFEKGTQYTHKLTEGVAWKYDVNAISNSDCKLSYILAFDKNGDHIAPEGLIIDKETGVMSWENPVKGEHKVSVTVKSTCDKGATYITIFGKFNLIVKEVEPDFSSTLKCNFSEENTEIKNFYGKVTVWSAEHNDPGVPPSHNRHTFTAELRGASVSFKLPAGKYFLRADVKGYKGQYYETAFELSDAKVIKVGDNEKVEVSMILHALPTPEFHFVTGQVVDAETGEPLSAFVTFTPTKMLNGLKINDHNDLNFINKVKTDDKGNYSIKLPNTFEYYASADVLTKGERYLKQWFEGADAYYEANVIRITGDLDNINFKMKKRAIEKGYLSGNVADLEGNIVQSTVIALFVSSDNDTEFKAVTNTDADGNYYFENLRYGNYILLSLPDGTDYFPGYYVMGEETTLRWKKATQVSVGDFAPTVMVEILHKKAEADQARGIAKIKGRLLKAVRGIVNSDENPSADSDYINGGLVSLVNSDNNLVGYYVTDSEGYYEIDGLEPGTYTLNIDKFGYEEYSETIVIDYSKEIVSESEVELNESSVTTVNYGNAAKINLTVSPMPVNGVSNVTFIGTAGTTDVRLVDMTGNTVYSTTMSTINGNNHFDLDSKSIPAGAYIVIINNNENVVAGGITIIK